MSNDYENNEQLGEELEQMDESIELDTEESVSVESDAPSLNTIDLDLGDQAAEPELPVVSAMEDDQDRPVLPTNVIDDFDPDELQEALDSETEDAEKLAVAEIVQQLTVNMKDVPFMKIKSGTPVDPSAFLPTLMLGIPEIETIFEKYELDFDIEDPDELKKLPEHIRRLMDAISAASSRYQRMYFQNIHKRPGSNWGQGLEMEGGALLRQSLVNPKDNGTNPVASIATQLGMGTVIQVPMWHSGVWLAIKTPRESALIELEQRISAEKTGLGRATNGAVFSNNECFAKNEIIEFALRHVVRSTAESSDPDYLYDLLLETDYPMLCWGLLLATYPKGYRHIQPCIANPETCNHLVDTMLNLSRLAFVDRSRFTNAQRAHMANRRTPNTTEKIRAYQEELNLSANNVIKLNDSVELRLKVPTMAEARDAGIAWVDAITESARKVFTVRMNENARNEYRMRQAIISSLKQYVQWFSAVHRADLDRTYEDKAVVEELLTLVNEGADFSKIIHNRIKEYIDDVTLAIVALPKWKCPACQGEPDTEYMKHPDLIPIDIIDVFFTLLGQKVRKRLAEESMNIM